jgi:hypothetical protein
VLRLWANRNKLTFEEVSQQLVETLLGRLQRNAASLITAEAVAKIRSEASVVERKKLVRDICDGLFQFSVAGSDIPVWPSSPRPKTRICHP